MSKGASDAIGVFFLLFRESRDAFRRGEDFFHGCRNFLKSDRLRRNGLRDIFAVCPERIRNAYNAAGGFSDFEYDFSQGRNNIIHTGADLSDIVPGYYDYAVF